MACEYNDRQMLQFRTLPNEFQDLETAYRRHHNIQQNQVRPANRHPARLFDKRAEIGDALLRRVRHVPVERDSSPATGGLKEHLVIGAVIHMKYPKGGPG